MRLEFDRVTVFRSGGVVALEEFSFVFDDAKCSSYALIGANGAGKSTLFEAVVGLLSPAKGEIRLDGKALARKDMAEVRRRIGMVFQNSDDQLFSLTVGADVAFGPKNMKLSPEEVGLRVDEALGKLDIKPLAGRNIVRLSGGEKRRAALAGVLAMRPEAVLLDEPTSMLDPKSCREFAGYLNELPAMKLIASHDLEFVRRTCRECLVLKSGRLAASGPLEQILSDRELLLDCGLA